jgi:hypothetical protein
MTINLKLIMKSTIDLLIVVPLLLGYIGARVYAGILLSRIKKKKGRLRFSSVALPAQDIHQHELIRISMRCHDKEKVRFLQHAGKCILCLLISFVISSLLFEGRSQAKDSKLPVIAQRR